MTDNAIHQESVRQWLSILHADSPGYVHIAATDQWAGPSYPTNDIAAAVQRVCALEQRQPLGIYTRMTTLRAPLKPGARGGAADSQALTTLWADLDIAGPAHKDKHLPPSWRAVHSIVASSGLPQPTLWIDSGHGAYPMWLLNAPLILNGDNLADVADLSANWQRVIEAASKKLGWHYGAGVGDLARVLRIPGTVNRKAGQQRLCRILSETVTPSARYTVERLFEQCADAMATVEQPPKTGARDATRIPHRAQFGELSPGDDFAARTTWVDILQPHGWRLVRHRGSIQDWCRPGKATGVSATTNALGTDRLHVFTTSTDFDTTSYSKFGAFAVLEHRGDHSAAASALKARGFGTPSGDTEQIRAYLAGLTPHPPPLPTPQPVPAPVSVSASNPDSPSAAEPTVLGDQPDAEVLDARTLAELRYRQEIAAEAHRIHVHRQARKKVDAEEFAQMWREPPSRPTLTDDLAEPDPPIRYRLHKLLPAGGNAMLTAAFKAGKTTICNNLIRSLADGEPFLDKFDVTVPDGRIAAFNYEMSDGQFRQWLRQINIQNTDRVCVLNLRGYRLPMTDPQVEDWIAKWLLEHDVKVWIVDPFARAMVGSGDENSNTDVGAMLDAIDVIKNRAGVCELVLPSHTGRAEQAAGLERARGATRLDDWADVRWLLTADAQGRRFFRAHGRDVDVAEELLSFDVDTGRLALGGWDRQGMANKDRGREVAAWVKDHPGLGANEIIDGLGCGRTRGFAALKHAVGDGLVIVTGEGTRGKRLHYVAGTSTAVIAAGACDGM